MSENSERGYTWMPVGRSGWDSQTCHQIIRHIQSDEFKQNLLEVGFGKGQSDFFEAAIDNFKRSAEGSFTLAIFS